jgi:hypothetical protein
MSRSVSASGLENVLGLTRALVSRYAAGTPVFVRSGAFEAPSAPHSVAMCNPSRHLRKVFARRGGGPEDSKGWPLSNRGKGRIPGKSIGATGFEAAT